MRDHGLWWMNYMWRPMDPRGDRNDHLTDLDEYATLRNPVPEVQARVQAVPVALNDLPPVEVYDK